MYIASKKLALKTTSLLSDWHPRRPSGDHEAPASGISCVGVAFIERAEAVLLD